MIRLHIFRVFYEIYAQGFAFAVPAAFSGLFLTFLADIRERLEGLETQIVVCVMLHGVEKVWISFGSILILARSGIFAGKRVFKFPPPTAKPQIRPFVPK